MKNFDEFAQLLKASAKKKKENQEYKDKKERMDFCFQVNQVTVSKLMNIKLPLNFFVFL